MIRCVAAVALATTLVGQDVIRIGSKNFAESHLLAELMAAVIEDQTDLVVETRRLGGTMLCWQALQSGEIDIYAEYTGTAWTTILGRVDKIRDPLRAFFEVQRRCREQHGVHWLAPFGLNNTYALAMREDRAEQLGVRRISDLLRHQSELRAGFGIEFGERSDGYPGLQQAYGLRLHDVRIVDHALGYEAIRRGVIDLIDAYSTDGKLLRFDLRVLEDDRGFFPPYHAAPVVRGATLAQHPVLGPALDRLAFRLSDRDAQVLNYLIEAEGHPAEAVARAFLEEAGLLAGVNPPVTGIRDAFRRMRRTPIEPGAAVGERPGLLAALARSWRELLWLVLQHIWLTFTSVALAAAIAVPLGVVIATRPVLRGWVLGVAGVVQTIPSLALLALMVPLLGLSMTAALVALVLYALLPILHNTVAGLQGIDADVVDAARGIGMREREILFKVQLPLATPTILAGVRTSAVLTVGVATLAAFLGAGGLGQPILQGINLNDPALVLLGAIPAALLAIFTDRLLAGLCRFGPNRRWAATAESVP